MTRAIIRANGALALAALVIALVPAPAHAAAYRYWTYWQAAPTSVAWSFATQGPGTAVPADGAVEGWAFGVTTDSASPEDAPASLPDFAAVCGDTPAQPDSKRVALVVDPGPAAIAPAGQTPPAPLATCVVAAPDASGYEILRSVAEVRTDNGLVCAVAGYPAGECAPVLDGAEAAEVLAAASEAANSAVASGSPSASATPVDGSAAGTQSSSGTPLATVGVVALLVIGVVVWIVVSRRRHREVPDA
jgi:hypothetical protein